MREIKFRAWDGKDMWTGFDILPDNIIVPPAYRKTKVALDFMQYTGLKDKNGVEIYEGDILRFKRKTTESVEVRFRDDGYKCAVKTGVNTTTHYGLSHFLEKYQCEVIGNIYENPDLLEQAA